MSDELSPQHPFAPYEAHPFAASAAASEPAACAFCGEHRGHILHHPTRIRAACLLRGLDPSALLPPQERGGSVAPAR